MKSQRLLLAGMFVLVVVPFTAQTSADVITVTHGIGLDSFPASNVTAVVLTSWGATGTQGLSLSYTGIAGTIDGVNFTYDITVTRFGVNGALPDGLRVSNSFGATGSLFEADGPAAGKRFDADEGVSIAISNISNVNVVFDGFTAVGADFTGPGQGWNVNGTDYIRGATLDPRETVALNGAPEAAFNAYSIGPTHLRNVEFQFSKVPEPSSVALCGAACLLWFVRRRQSGPATV